MPRAELMANVKDAKALFCLLTDAIDEELLANANDKLAVVSTMSVGTFVSLSVLSFLLSR